MKRFSAMLLSTFLVGLGIIVILLCVFILPRLALETVTHSPEVAYFLFGLYATAVPFLYAIYETLHMIQIIEKQSITSKQLLQGFTRIKYCGIVIAALYIAGIIILDTANALPPAMALLGVIILFITGMVITVSIFMRHAIGKSCVA
ncbi:DUF2975 domain-containing protein [Solibacillus sp. FSL H8-0523]|uniref:DUF2975 domain-containing protein n=1 Tax=unclassified Solibacillus TaxID=2637870 RepID=UPI003100DA4E